MKDETRTSPATHGRTLIIPNRHITSYYEAAQEEHIAMSDLAGGDAKIPPNLPLRKGGVKSSPVNLS